MRLLRAKQGRKALQFFRITFGITPPYAVLLDGNFIHAAVSQKVKQNPIEAVKGHAAGSAHHSHAHTRAHTLTHTHTQMDIPARLKRQLNNEKFTLLVPQSVITELQALGERVKEAFEFATGGECEVVEVPEDLSGSDGIKHLVGAKNAKRYFVATQDEKLKEHLRGIPGVPVFYMQRNVLIFESPSTASRHANKMVSSTTGTHVGVCGGRVGEGAHERRC